ncbi:MAG: hypothetical protein CMN30_29345 [Sandaracinus sp.]|nr:hypothetical protein [Sandaracinus sp.]|tara:strand:+ start:508 stop:1410 length:903 start_codon:yes stop_codon:yes gene_type:complete
MPSDYYEMLGVERSASDREIKRAFRRLAKELHPDCTGGCPNKAARFKEVSEAYSTLSDPEKRSRYDQFGEVGEIGADGFGFDFQSMMNDLGGAAAGFGIDFESFFGGGERAKRPPRQRRGRDVALKVQVPMLDALRGGEQKVSYQAGGTQVRDLRVRVPAGSRSGDQLRVPGRGTAGSGGGSAGDLKIELEVVPLPGLRWEGENLVMDLPLTCLEAYRGATVEVGTMAGPVKLKVPAGARTGRKLRLRGKGPVRRGTALDLIVRLVVELPEGSCDQVAAAFEQVESAYGTSVRAKLPPLG